jgi:hypothetical protein
VLRVVTGSDVANAALRSVLKNVSKPDSQIRDRAAFYHLLRKVVKRKAASAFRRETADMRDVRRQVPLPMDGPMRRPRQRPGGADDLVQRRERSAAERAEGKELAEDVDRLLMREPDEIKRRVKILGIMHWLQANEILRVLAIEFPGKPLPSRSAVHVMTRETRNDLPAALAKYWKQKRHEAPTTQTLSKGIHETKKTRGTALPEEYAELVRPRKQRDKTSKTAKNASQKNGKKSDTKRSAKVGKKSPAQGRKKVRKRGG